ncbi:MAG: 5-bromo-4-chloroindolyl phosphate hydrolysis family protein [Oscillospiraceae bacterium]|nr:5-bromo-4-chloroindolyl phosphate hydrolysis family protein [Oscillospiraceae bacterium]
MKEVKKPSVVPIYGTGAAILLYNLLLPMYRPLHVLLCAALAVAGYLVLLHFFPGTTVYVEQPEPAPDTGSRELDEAILQGRETIAELRQLNERIPDAEVSQSLSDIERLTQEMFRQVEQQQQKLQSIRRMLNYYLPTTLKLVRKYAELQDQANLGSVSAMLGQIRDMLRTVETALQNQVTRLYENDAVDITADIRVMEQMLRSQGLSGEQDFDLNQKKE